MMNKCNCVLKENKFVLWKTTRIKLAKTNKKQSLNMVKVPD